MSVSSAPPTAAINPSAAATGGAGAGGGGTAVVVQVLAAYGGDSVRNGLIQTLQNAVGAGNVLSGTVADIRGDGTFTLQTKAGVDLTLQRPPDLPLSVGSSLTVRLVATNPQPQLAILTVDGKLVSAPPSTASAAAGSPLFNPVASTAPTVPPPYAPPAGLSGLPPATLAATLIATISLEDEVAIESALSGGNTIVASTADAPVEVTPDSVVATLVRPAPARPGAAPIAPGTRYLASLQIGNADAEPATALTVRPAAPSQPAAAQDTTEPVEPAAASTGETAEPPPADPTATPAAPPPTTLDLSNFKALATVLAGRVLASSSDSETLVETPVGTLSIPVQDAAPPIGASVQLKIIAVAPPLAAAKPAVAEAPPAETPTATQAPLEAAAAALAPVAPLLAQQVQSQLSLAPGDELTSLILNFLAGLKSGPPAPRWPDPPVRKVLIDTGHGDVAAKLDAEASQIGRQQPAPPGQWAITVLPFLGSATAKPMRLYRRSPDAEEQEKGGGERFVVELEMVRLGALQFDGLVRERRFDLVVRSEKPLDDDLKPIVERTFRDSLLIAGWAGELSYAKTGPVPMIPLPPEGSGVGLEA